jgi:xanthine dehydrogenase accessory factor
MDLVEVAGRVEAWLAAGQPVGVGWPVAFAGFSSLPPGQAVAVSDGDQQTGEVVGPSVTAAVIDDLRGLLPSGPPWCRLVRLPVDERAAAEAGLSCGGTVTVALQHGAAVPSRFWAAVAAGEPVAMVSRLPGDDGRATVAVLVEVDGTLTEVDGTLTEAGRLGPDEQATGAGRLGPDGQATEAARLLLAEGGVGGRVVPDGDATLVVVAVAPDPRLVVVGEGVLAGALVRQAALLGWRAEVRPDRASALHAIGRLPPGHGVVVLSHDPDVGVPALAAALARRAGYVGALGSRRTQADRRERLLASGVAEADIDLVHGPAGLDLGGRAPQEVALAICAEMLAVRSGRRAVPLRERDGPINR